MRDLREHELKTLPEMYDDIICGVKNFEVRRNDRDFAVGDTLVLYEYDPDARRVDENQVEHVGAYTGRHCRREVQYVLRRFDGVTEGYVVMALAPSRWTPSVAAANGPIR